MESRVPARLTAAEGRRFAFPVGVAFGVLAGIVWWRDHLLLARVFGGLAGVLLLAGLVLPSRLGPVQRAWMGLAHAISRVTNPIFMGIVYYLVITPIGIVRRVVGRHPIHHEALEDSYWRVRPENRRRADLNRQF